MSKLKTLGLAAGVIVVILFLILVFYNFKNDSVIETDVSVDEQALKDLVLWRSKPSQTQLAAQDLAGILVGNNLEGPKEIDGQLGIAAMSPDDFAQKFLVEKINEAGADILGSDIDKTRIIVVANSEDAFWNYLLKSSEVVRENAELFQSEGVNLAEPDVIDFELATRIYENSIEKIYALAVPENLLFVHEERLRLLIAYKNVFLSLANYEADPLSASVAITILESLDKDTDSLNEVIADIINKYQT